MDSVPQVRFPCEAIPADPAEARLVGIYPQRQPGLFMQRVRVLGGKINAAQLRGLAALARRYSGERLLHLTTRQDVELHSVRPEDVPAVQRGVHAVGLTTVGACGDTVRNIVVCPHNGFCRGTWDLRPLGEAIYGHVESLAWIRQLPRKFKISLSACAARCARPWANDIGLVANPDGTFQAVLGGSLGGRSSTGALAYPSIALPDVLPLVTATLRLFFDEGDRRVRAKARLRHVRERLGDEAFQRRVDALFCAERQRAWPDPPALRRVESDTPLQAHLRFPLGDLLPEVAVELAAAAKRAKAEVRIGLEHDVLIFGPRPVELPAAQQRLARGPTLVACPGATWCKRGVVHTRDVARRILDAARPDCPLHIHLSGCPSNCAVSAIADIGLVGRIRQRGGQRMEAFQLLVGGGNGRTPALAQELHPAVPAGEAEQVIAWLWREYQSANGNDGLAWADFVRGAWDRLAEILRTRYPASSPQP